MLQYFCIALQMFIPYSIIMPFRSSLSSQFDFKKSDAPNYLFVSLYLIMLSFMVVIFSISEHDWHKNKDVKNSIQQQFSTTKSLSQTLDFAVNNRQSAFDGTFALKKLYDLAAQQNNIYLDTQPGHVVMHFSPQKKFSKALISEDFAQHLAAFTMQTSLKHIVLQHNPQTLDTLKLARLHRNLVKRGVDSTLIMLERTTSTDFLSVYFVLK